MAIDSALEHCLRPVNDLGWSIISRNGQNRAASSIVSAHVVSVIALETGEIVTRIPGNQTASVRSQPSK